MQAKSLCILLGSVGQPPYEETAPASILETINAAVLGQLLTRNNSFELQPGLIKSWHWDYEKNVYELTLRDDIIFHNGRKATAEDLEFALLRGFFTKYRSFYNLFLNNIDGIEATRRFEKFQSGAVRGVKITGPYTVEIKLKTPNPTFLYNLTFAYFSLVAKEALQDNYIQWRSLPVGTGPYRFIEQDLTLGKFVLEKVKSDYPSAPQRIELYTKPAEIEYDIVAFTDPSISQEVYKIQHPKYPASVWGIFFVNINPLGSHPTFHKAVQYGVNRMDLLKDTEPHRPAYELLPSHFWGRANAPDPFDTKKAKELFHSLPNELKEKTWSVPVFGGKTFSEDKKILLERLRKQFAEFGFKVEFYPSVEKFLPREVAMESPIRVTGIVADYVEPVVMFSAFRKGSSPLDYEGPLHADAFADRLYTEASKAQTPHDRLRTVRALSNYFNEMAIVVPLWEAKILYYVNQKTIKSMGEQTEPLYLLLERVVMK